MGSHPTLAHHQPATEALELDPDDRIHDHHRPAEPTSEQAFDQLNPTFGVPADRTDRIGHRDIQQREAALAPASAWPSTTAARTTPARSSGRPARTTASPTPSRLPATSPPALVGGRSGSGPNDNHQHYEGA